AGGSPPTHHHHHRTAEKKKKKGASFLLPSSSDWIPSLPLIPFHRSLARRRWSEDLGNESESPLFWVSSSNLSFLDLISPLIDSDRTASLPTAARRDRPATRGQP
uniref:Uncharacterized protein n=1 Tax=Aegilops tauschii subsp. strangulata TaxID=200361 RepID=A0A453TD79_AEGTS